MIEVGANPNCMDSKGNTALMAAAAKGNVKVVDALIEALIEAGADVNATNGHGNRALRKALFYHKTECALSLLKAGADTRGEVGPGVVKRGIPS